MLNLTGLVVDPLAFSHGVAVAQPIAPYAVPAYVGQEAALVVAM